MVPFVLDKSGVVLAMNPAFFEKIGLQRQRNNPDLPGVIHVQNILDSNVPEIVAMGARILDGAPHIGTVVLNGMTYILASRQMPSTGWSFGLVVPETVLLASVHETRDNLTATVKTLSHRFSLATIISIVLSVSIMALLMRRMTSPIKKLSRLALQVKSGNLSVRIDRAGQDETGILGRSFNEMLDALERGRQREQEYTSTLEARVRERTQALLANQTQLEHTLRQLEEEMTERRQREEDLRESRNMLQLVMNNIPQAVFWKDTRSVYLGCNRTFAQAAGLAAPADIIGKTDYDLPWATREADAFIADDRRVMQTGSAILHIIEMQLQAGGRKAWLDTNKVPLRNSENVVVGVLGTYEDITEKKKSEEDRARLISAIEQASELIVIMDASGTVLYVNPYALDLTRYSVAEVIGTKPFEARHATSGEAFLQDIWAAISRGRSWRGHITMKKKGGGAIDVQAVITPVRDKEGAIISYVAISRDITTELQLQRELRQAQKMEAIGTLAGGIAHDFNNILAVIMGYTEMCLLQVPADSRPHAHLTQIFTASVRAQHLIQQMLTFSRQGDLEAKPVSLTPLIKETVKFLRASLPSTITIQERLEAASDVVMGDPTQIHQIIMNLCANAKHAMGESGGRLTISLRETVLDDIALAGTDMEPGRYVQLSVSDTGCGIAETIQEKIFNPFFTTKKPGEGTGLGLSVVHGIVRNLKGSIRLTSRPGQGATFDIALPVIETQAQVQEAQAAYDEAAGSERILVVDDEEQITDMTKRMLEMLGYAVTTRTSSVEALECFRYNPHGFDLVITDQTMPQMTGMQLAREMLAIRPSLPIVLCTGFSEVITEKKALAGGVRAFLMKPIVRSEFTRTIRRVLDGNAQGEPHGNGACYRR
jgi:PAS domain S-box-containing protein